MKHFCLGATNFGIVEADTGCEGSSDEICKLDHQELNKEIQDGVQHIEKAQQLETEIEELKKQRTMIECRLAVSALQYTRMKASLPTDINI